MGPLRTRNSTRAGKALPDKPRRKPNRQPAHSPFGSVLRTVRSRLETVRAGVITASCALVLQNADIDSDVALLLRRFVVDELGRQIETLDAVLAGRTTS
jgi:hypothetical protein